MPTTSRWGLRYPSLSEAADVPLDIQELAQDLDDVAKDNFGTLAARPPSTPAAPGKAGRYYWASDTGKLYRDNGTGWNEIGPGTIPDGSVTEPKYVTDSVSQRAIAPASVGADEIIDLSIGTGKLADLSVTGAKISNALKPSAGATSSAEALRALGTEAGTAAAGNDSRFTGDQAANVSSPRTLGSGAQQAMAGNAKKTFRTYHSFALRGLVETGYVPGFFISLASGETVSLIKAIHKIRTGTSVGWYLWRNTAFIDGYGTNISAIGAGQAVGTTDPADVPLADNDWIDAYILTATGSPNDFELTLILEHTV